MIQELRAKFIDLYSVTPRMFRSPGRINIIGEHTDYNDGFVLPAAIDKEIVFAVAPNTTGTFRFYATDLNDFGEFPDIVPQTDKK
ncbi:MAG: galactokinase, partial [Bacteroidales bacterium]|nr:galactokinase [Bacteroidales bacterium]